MNLWKLLLWKSKTIFRVNKNYSIICGRTLVSVDEKKQRAALKLYYEERYYRNIFVYSYPLLNFREQVRANNHKLDRALFFAKVVNPSIAVGFVVCYSLFGYSSMNN